MRSGSPGRRGRGAASNPPNRFECIRLERDSDWNPQDDPAPRTCFYRDQSQTVISYNDSPDIAYRASLNPYRGCEHGCAYCYARPFHEFLGFSAGLDFETKIMVKEDAPELLRQELSSAKWQPQTLTLSGVTDPYQPVERRLQLTRRCLQVLVEFRNPTAIVTKNHLITRDLDLLNELAQYSAIAVNLSLTSLDADLARRLEPRTSAPRQRLEAIGALAKAGIPVGVSLAPVIPVLTEHEIPAILRAAADAGARWAGVEVLRLPYAVGPLFEEWLTVNEPGKKEKILNRIRSLRGGKLNDPRFGFRMRGEGIFAEQISQMFHVACRKAGLALVGPSLSTAAFRRPGPGQMELTLAGALGPLGRT
jgi:DNA repair photolyase